MTDHDPQPAASLAAQFPGWKIWHGKHTGSWWAVPPAGHPHGGRSPDVGPVAYLPGHDHNGDTRPSDQSTR